MAILALLRRVVNGTVLGCFTYYKYLSESDYPRIMRIPITTLNCFHAFPSPLSPIS